MPTKKINITDKLTMGGDSPFVLIAGPCVIESEEHTLHLAASIKASADELSIPFVFKASFDKANRTSLASYRGPGLEEGLRILHRVKEEYHLPLLSDVSEQGQVERAAEVLDIIQIPAFLCRQTDLILAVARSGKVVNVKKGQFLAPWDVGQIINKVVSTGNEKVMITERGTSFGYNNLVVDMKSLSILKGFGYPVIFDVTHSLQLPGGRGDFSGGRAEFIEPLARAGLAIGIDGLFMEVHDDPSEALSDGTNVLKLELLPQILPKLKEIDRVVKGF
ncbi:MAG: 3-deoxy-8-phosphooctulonate synthase [Candidatus Aminicenantes bacterium]|nr:3-deoxy-8-phosphooctulonate synthase [Candidatus Aminicenantes bacterium]MDH5714607.1 3-deoxy-8-phosphooctulonate synthase [Candidatus Aminicenantes bacterium]